jgi:P-type Cu+ transporter
VVGCGADAPAAIVLIKSRLEDVAMAIDLSRATFRRIRVNYVWASAYNLVAIPIAMGALVPWGFVVRARECACVS